MAECRKFDCSKCEYQIQAWSDGNPYYIDEAGEKVYAYHPSADFAKCTGNEDDLLCLDCGEEFRIDIDLATSKDCPKCHKSNTSDLFELNDKSCPQCRIGSFILDENFHAIS